MYFVGVYTHGASYSSTSLPSPKMERKNWLNHGNHDDFLRMFSSDKKGFKKWCKYLHSTIDNRKNLNDTTLIDEETKDLYEIVPCASEFYRYVQWHNLALEVAEDRLEIPVHTLFYEDYSLNYNETVEELLGFLELQAVSTPPDFIQGKEYHEYFTEASLRNVARLVKHLSSKKTWKLLKHYFEGVLEEVE